MYYQQDLLSKIFACNFFRSLHLQFLKNFIIHEAIQLILICFKSFDFQISFYNDFV